MSNQTSQSENGATQLDHIQAASQGRSATSKWGFVFHRFNSTAGNFSNTNIDISDSLGDVMERARTQYQVFLPTSRLRRFVSKVVIDQAIVDYSSTHSIENQAFPIQVKVHTNIRHDQLTEAFYDPQNFRNVSVQNDEFAIFSSPTRCTLLSQTVVSLRIVPNKKRLFWILVLTMLAILILAGIVAGMLSTSMGTSFLVVGTLMGLFSLFVAVATVLWKNQPCMYD